MKLGKGLDIGGHIVGALPMLPYSKPKYGVYGPTWRYIEFEKPIGFFSMTFLIRGTKTCGIIVCLRDTSGNVERWIEFWTFKIILWTSVDIR